MLGQPAAATQSRGVCIRKLTETAGRLGFSLNPQTPVHRLTVGERQQLELTRLLSMGIDLLILDEPTTGISEYQKNTLFQSLKSLAREGKTIVLVSHKLGDVESLCDEVTVLRQGRITGSISGTPSRHDLVNMMFGGELSVENARIGSKSDEVILDLDSVTVTGGRTGLHDCSVTVHRGEIVGLAGLEGSGQAEFLRAASGVRHPVRGNIRFQGKDMKHVGYRAFRNAGAVFLPQSRLEEGLIAGLTIADHLALVETTGFLLNPLGMEQRATRRIQDFRIRGNPESPVEFLSGGNQQRLLLSLLPDHPSVLLLENPTRGLDLDSTRWVWNLLRHYAENGTAVVFSSSELDEIMTFADRILVFYNGRIQKDVDSRRTDISELGRIIAGTSP
jgi:simple sugar transport system ATP-binding protein